jgi:hypothetical protein
MGIIDNQPEKRVAKRRGKKIIGVKRLKTLESIFGGRETMSLGYPKLW